MVLVNQLTAEAKRNVITRPVLHRIAAEGGMGRARLSELYRMFYSNGPGQGTMLSLPFDQLVEHGVGHALKWDRSADPRAVIELANKGIFSALVLSIGQAEKYQNLIRPDLPLIVKVDGHFLIGKEVPYPRQSNMATVHRAIRAGANAIGFTMYLGGEETEQDVERVAEITEAAHDCGKPVFMWAYTRGPLPEKMGPDSLYWCAQGISAAESIGVDVVKQKYPVPSKNPEVYRQCLSESGGSKGYLLSKMPEVDQLLSLEPEVGQVLTMDQQVKRLSFMSQIAPNTLKIISGGPKTADPQKDLIETTECVMSSGCEGRIVGRQLWGRPIEEALELNRKIVEVMRRPDYRRPNHWEIP